MKIKYLAVLLLSVGLLAGCGGSSSSSSGPAPLAIITIDSSNSSKVAYGAISDAALNLKNYSPIAVQTTTVSSNDRDLYTVTDFAMQKILEQQNAAASVTGATESHQCILNDAASGTYVYTYDTPTTSWVTATFTNCKLSTNSTKIVNGTFSITGWTVTTSTSATVSINLTITTTGKPTVKFVGGYTLNESGIGFGVRTDTLAGSSMVYSVGPLNEALTNFSFSSTYDDYSANPSAYRAAFRDSVSYTISSDFTGGSFTLTTTPGKPLLHQSTDSYHRDGQVVISGAKSSALRVTVVSTDPNAGISSAATVTLELSTDGGVTYGTAVTKTWAQLASGL